MSGRAPDLANRNPNPNPDQIALRSDWAKGYSRKGAALFGLGRYAEAIGTYQQGLAYEPDNVQMRQACVDIEDKLQLSKTLFEAVTDGSVPRTTAALHMGASPDAFTVRRTRLEPQPSRLKIDLPLTRASPALDRRQTRRRSSALSTAQMWW